MYIDGIVLGLEYVVGVVNVVVCVVGLLYVGEDVFLWDKIVFCCCVGGV